VDFTQPVEISLAKHLDFVAAEMMETIEGFFRNQTGGFDMI
jgi:hypothetical protein